ncbi:MAG: RidA family protein [Bacteroidales bacterium]|nr:RidA family protein [Bacteroidales bacterium]
MKKIIATPDAPAAIGPYSQAVELNGTLYLSGQLPVDPASGRMPEGIEAQTRQALRNLGAILAASGLGYGDIVKTTVLLADIADFGAMNAVYAEFFPDDKPARVCYQIAALPRGARVEIDAVAGR